MGNVKKLLATAVLASACVLSGCGGGVGEEAVVREALELELAPIVQLDEVFIAETAAGMESELAKYGVDPESFVEAFFGGFSYQIGQIEVEGDAARAEVTLECKSVFAYSQAIGDAAEALAEGGELAGASAGDVSVALGEVMLDAWEGIEPTPCAPIVVELYKADGAWHVSLSAQDAVFGTLMNH